MDASNRSETGVLVVGGGPAGYVAAIRAGQLGLDATLVDREAYGGACLNRGCIPSKALLSAAEVAHAARNGEAFGVAADVDVDFARMVGWKDGVVERLTDGVEGLCEANGVRLLAGHATFTGEHTARVSRDDGGDVTVSFDDAVVATGSRPVEIPGFGYADDPVLDSRAALSLDIVPAKLLVVGAGYIGMELSTLFAKLGTEVTVVEVLDSAMPQFDADLVEPVVRRAESLGVDFRFERRATGWEYNYGTIAVSTESASGDGRDERAFDADYALVAVGRRPVTDGLGLDALGLEPDERGFLPTDDAGRTDAAHVFAVGDVAGEPMLAHKGSAEGAAVAEIIAGEASELASGAVPAVVFTEPEVATVGHSPGTAERDGIDAVTGTFPFRASGRALTTGEEEGFVRVVADGADGRIAGGQVVGPEASELIAELGVAVETGATLEDVAKTVHAHPTLGEAVGEACEHALGRAIHTRNR